MIRRRRMSLPLLLTALALVALTSAARAQFLPQGGKLFGSGAVGNAFQGLPVSLSADGNTAIWGGFGDNSLAGATWVFTRSAGGWSQQGSKLVGSGAVGGARQGISVRLSADGNTAVVGGPFDASGAGAAWVFVRNAGVWSQQGTKLVGSGAVGNAQQGISVAISGDGNTILVGGHQDNALAGAAWVFTRSGSTWSQQGAKLVGSGATGNAQLGISAALSYDGNTAVVGGSRDNANLGAVWVFTRSGSTWSQQGARLVGTGFVGASRQGYSVAVSSDGNTLITGARADNANAGAAWVFTRSGSTWSQQGAKLVGSDAAGNALQGISVALSADGNLAAVGGPDDATHTGATWIYSRTGSTWSQQGAKLVGGGATGFAGQGGAVALSSNGVTLISGGSDDNALAGAAWVWVAMSADAPDSPSGSLSLARSEPNPVRGIARIRFVVPRTGHASLRVYDVAGREVRRLVDRVLPAGVHDETFDAGDLAGGVFFYRLEHGGTSVTRKLVVEP